MKQELLTTKQKQRITSDSPNSWACMRASHEHDACGVGMLVNIQGRKIT